MTKYYLLATILAFTSTAFAQLTLEQGDLGEIYQGNQAQTEIAITNVGDEPIAILRAFAISEYDRVKSYPKAVPPHSTAYIPVLVASEMDAGDRHHLFRVETDYQKRPKMDATVHLFGMSILDDPSPRIDFGTVDTDVEAVSQKVMLSSSEMIALRIESVLSVPNFVAARIVDGSRGVEISPKRSASWGRHRDFVKVKLNSVIQPAAWIEVLADVHGEIIPSENPIELGVLRGNEIQPKIVQFVSRDGKDFKLGAISVEGFKAVAKQEICVGHLTGCRQISIRLAEDQLQGRIDGQLLIEIPGRKEKLPVEVSGLYFQKNTKVHMLGEKEDEDNPTVRPQVSEGNTKHLDKELANAVDASKQPEVVSIPPGKGPLIRWEVSNQNFVYGYLIYRADEKDGPFLRINGSVIRTNTEMTDSAPSAYSWRDESARVGKTYWYYIGLINRDGTKKPLSDPQKVVAK